MVKSNETRTTMMFFKIRTNPEFAYSFRILNRDIFSFYSIEGLGWFRIFGYGIRWKDITKHFLFFSERNGITKYFQIKNYRFYYLN